jgi:hypothetical protein
VKCFLYKNKYPLLGVRFGEPLTLLETLLTPSIEENLLWLSLTQSKNGKEFYSRPKYLSEVSVKQGPDITLFWRELCHLHTIGGFFLACFFREEEVETLSRGSLCSGINLSFK